ncbi:MAG: type II toxin-antitoxin system VapC family toxin [Limisphaerales bacterium]
MIALDTNLLVYAHREDSGFHGRAKSLVEGLRLQPASWAIPWPCVHEFVGIVTHPRIYQPPSKLGDALAAVDAWLAGGNLEMLSEGSGYWTRLRGLAASARLTGPRMCDARIAAICLHHGVREFWSADRDFSAFPKLKVRNPLIEDDEG